MRCVLLDEERESKIRVSMREKGVLGFRLEIFGFRLDSRKEKHR